MKIAIYPGSFNPFHEGHLDIVKQILPLVDKLIVAIGRNPAKTTEFNVDLIYKFKERTEFYSSEVNEGSSKIEVQVFDGLLVDHIKKCNASFLIKGIRNAIDFQYEKDMQYWNEDLGIKIPTLYIIANRNLTHISSSAIRAIRK